jgi:hypothetical protein
MTKVILLIVYLSLDGLTYGVEVHLPGMAGATMESCQAYRSRVEIVTDIDGVTATTDCVKRWVEDAPSLRPTGQYRL